MAERRPALPALTGLRFFAAMWVVLGHFGGPLVSGTPLLRLAGFGYVGVSMFYLLSGFILAYIYLGADGRLLGTRRRFYVARLARVGPCYVLALALAAVPYLVWHDCMDVASCQTSPVVILPVSLLALQAWLPFTTAWNPPAWSLSVEAFFYLVFPVLIVVLARRRRLVLWLAGLWLAGLVAPLVVTLLDPSGAGVDVAGRIVRLFPPLRLPEFACGVLLGILYVRGKFAGLERVSGHLSGLAAGALVLVLLVFTPPYLVLHDGMLDPLLGLLIVGLALGGGRVGWLCSLPPVVLLGEISYGIYILQVPVWDWFTRLFPSPSSVEVAVYLATLIATAYVSWRLVEQPARGAVRRLAIPKHRITESMQPRAGAVEKLAIGLTEGAEAG